MDYYNTNKDKSHGCWCSAFSAVIQRQIWVFISRTFATQETYRREVDNTVNFHPCELILCPQMGMSDSAKMLSHPFSKPTVIVWAYSQSCCWCNVPHNHWLHIIISLHTVPLQSIMHKLNRSCKDTSWKGIYNVNLGGMLYKRYEQRPNVLPM